MNRKQLAYEDRVSRLVARIVEQRSQLEWQIGALRKPMQAFELARSLGESLRSHARLVSAAAVFAGLLLMRGKLASRVRRSVQIARSGSRWWVLARLGWQVLRRRRSTGSVSPLG